MDKDYACSKYAKGVQKSTHKAGSPVGIIKYFISFELPCNWIKESYWPVEPHDHWPSKESKAEQYFINSAAYAVN